MKVLVTGGAGYIGSTVASACVDEGITPVILDSFVTGRAEFAQGRPHYQGDIADGALIDQIFGEHSDIVAVIHCAARIVVPESVAQPIMYYRENVVKTLDLAEHLIRNGCQRLLFSSSAAFYEPGPDFAVDENSAIVPLSPYARTKAVVESMLADVAEAHPLRVMSLRYFNPIGADPKMRTGLQLPTPSHALGKLIEARRASRPFGITGTDYPTRDGSGIRDYVHVWDLAQAHLAALWKFDEVLPAHEYGSVPINLGTGRGTTVKELVAAFNAVTGQPLTTVEAPRRAGDSVGAFTLCDRARKLLDWNAKLSIEDGIRDSLEWSAWREEILSGTFSSL